jgi:PPOX class probable FMN-dependent enzyme
MTYIESLDDLRLHYAQPAERTLRKQLAKLDVHCRNFIALAPFVVMATTHEGRMDASPRGGAPGFVKVADETTLWIPDDPGNNRLDSLSNIVASGRIGLLFLIPGVDEALRVNGGAQLSVDAEKRAQLATEKRTPKLVIEVTVEEAYLHCAKALMRARLWASDAKQERRVLPTMAEMLADHTGTAVLETQEEMLARYQRDL